MDELQSLFDALQTLGETPSRRRRWVDRIVRGIAVLGILATLTWLGLLASHRLTGWPPG